MTGINPRNSRRGYNYKCLYYKKINKNDMTLKHNETPNGVFFAKEVRDILYDNQEIVGSYQNHYKTVTIETPDNVEVDQNDIVNFDNLDWLVIEVNEIENVKRTKFSNIAYKGKIIGLRR